jgi:hypothetical protein
MNNKHHLKPGVKFTGWRCDSCGGAITSVRAGWVEWLASEDKKGNDVLSGLRLVHVHRGPQQKTRRRNCQYDPRKLFRKNKTIVEGLPLNALVGADGLMVLLSLVAEGGLPHEAILELVKRVQVPGYELIRHLAPRGQQSKLLSPILGHRCYLQSEIREIIATGKQLESRLTPERKLSR